MGVNVQEMQQKVDQFLSERGIVLTPHEMGKIEIAELGLDEYETTGLALLTYVNNDRYCAKELVLLPKQTCPEHKHPPLSPSNPGKMETFRCRWGEVFLYVEGDPAHQPKAVVPESSKPYYTVFHEIVLRPGDQYDIPPNTFHWFQAGDQGAIITEFSSACNDETDVFIDPRIIRIPK
ncbi:D-lyxose/D-mannose family sugar isomerase [Cohnella nanjingensis]|uniref:D-lyxose ketol-isomerase n=1 Tax=Cohnella nanjingensis TaxID=1387779 RepID=A0A7X0RRA2_9BACL|nr:D-lyxose/D-mannose family sugar isomerase [Cohnella nanjingensis]MBB6670804.1 D-lyxose/D-mannose family sugar isomerase [Cohnella nanjingensis]